MQAAVNELLLHIIFLVLLKMQKKEKLTQDTSKLTVQIKMFGRIDNNNDTSNKNCMPTVEYE